jgi:acetylglutamate kinase
MTQTVEMDVHAKAAVLLEALPYLQRFQDSVFVVKIGGSFMEAPGALQEVATDIAFLATAGIKVVVVHGGGKAITRALAEAEIPTEFRNGLRVTDAQSIRIVQKTLNNVSNREIVDALDLLQARPIAVPGQVVLRCERLDTDDAGAPLDLGFVGRITAVDGAKLRAFLDAGHVPVVSPIAVNESGDYYNTNADVAAAHVAMALKARRLVFMSDVPGLLRDPKDAASLISTLRVAEVEGLKTSGVIGAGMVPKVDSAVEAIHQGVSRVHFVDGRLPHSLLLEIFTDRGIGTEIVRN